MLKEWLTPEQRTEYERYRFFTVKGTKSGNTYRIGDARGAWNVNLIRGGSIVDNLCFMPKGPRLPPGDIMLAQKLALETDEAAALRVANSHRESITQLGIIADTDLGF